MCIRDSSATINTDLIVTGSVSGSATSTGSFGRLMLGGQTIKSTTEGIAIVDDSEAYTLLSPPAAFQVVSEVDNQWFAYFRNNESTAGRNYGLYVRAGTNSTDSPFKIADKDDSTILRVSGEGTLGINTNSPQSGQKLHVVGDSFFTGNVSGSATSTGSFGRVELGQSNSAPMAIYGNVATAGIRLQNYKGYFEVDPHTSTVNITSDKDEIQFQKRIGARYGITGYSTGDLVFFTNSGNTTHATFSHFNGTSFTQNITGSGNLEIAGNISGSANSTGSFGKLEVGSQIRLIEGGDSFIKGGDLGIGTNTPVARLEIEDDNTTNAMLLKLTQDNNSVYGMVIGNDTFSTTDTEGGQHILGNDGTYIIRSLGTSTAARIGAGLAFNNYKYLEIDFDTDTAEFTTTNISGSATSTGSFGLVLQNGSELSTFLGDRGTETLFSGSVVSTGSFGRLDIVDNVSATSFTGIFQGALSGSAQIASNISGAFAVASASFAANILSNSSSFAARDTLSEATSSKILNGELEFTNITGSGHVSMSLSSTGSFGRVSATTIGGHSPLIVDSNTTFINSITSSAHVSSSMTSTASFGRVNVIALGGHQSLTIDPITTFTNVITASNKVQFDDKIFIETGSIEGDLHIRTNENLMRFGKSTNQLVVSASISASRFATGSDGSIIDLGFTAVDEEGNVVLTGEGDGIHVDSNNYWYNNKFYRVGNGRNDFLVYDDKTIKYSGEVVAQTGSFAGEMYINSPTGSMFIGKFTGGIPNSGSDNTSRFATGSDGSIIDLGFTTTDEDGNVILTTTGDGLHVDEDNYWYTSGHFKLGDGSKKIEWNTNNLNISASTVDVTTLKANDVNFSALPTSDPLTTGSLWISGSSSSGSYKSGFVMISGIHG